MPVLQKGLQQRQRGSLEQLHLLKVCKLFRTKSDWNRPVGLGCTVDSADMCSSAQELGKPSISDGFLHKDAGGVGDALEAAAEAQEDRGAAAAWGPASHTGSYVWPEVLMRQVQICRLSEKHADIRYIYIYLYSAFTAAHCCTYLQCEGAIICQRHGHVS